MGAGRPDRTDDELVAAVRAGDQAAYGELFDRWFDRVHDLSRRIVHDDGIAAEVAQDSFLAAWQGLDGLRDDGAFGGWILRIARNRSLNRLARERRATTPGDETVSAVADRESPGQEPFEQLDQAGRVALVWEAAGALGPADRSILDLHLRHGLSGAELADELGVTANNAHQKLFQLRKKLGGAVRALVLWRGGRPSCANLGVALEAAGSPRFGPEVVKLVDRHVATCADCETDRTERLSPAALFAAAPVIAAPVLLKAGAAEGLAAAGVPMTGSTAVAGASGGATGGGGGASGGDPVRGASSDGGTGTGSGGTSSARSTARAEVGSIGRPVVPSPPTVPAPAIEGPASAVAPAIDAGARRRRVAAVAIAAVFLLLVIAVVSTSGVDSDRLETAAGGGTSTTLGGTSSSIETATTAGAPKTMVVVPRTDPDPTDPGTAPTTAGTNPTVPTATDPTATDRPTTTAATTTTTQPPEPPVVLTVSVAGTKSDCERLPAWEVSWATSGAESVTVGPTGGPTSAGTPQGRATFCAPYSTTFVVSATGPGGTARGSSSAPDPPVG